MSALSWLRIARRVPGLGSQPEMPNLEALIDAEALQLKDEYHIARWVVPLVVGIVGLAVFVPLAVAISPLFLIGAIGMPVTGGILGVIFHLIARSVPPSKIRLRKNCRQLMARLNGLKNILGFNPVLSESVAAVLEEAAKLYLRVCPREAGKRGEKPAADLWTDAVLRARLAMDEAMAQMLTLAEPETAAAQEAELARGWAGPLLEEMKATARTIEEHQARSLVGGGSANLLAPLAGLRDARQELARLESAVEELEQEARG
jgi:hypothetical protein